jgi:hypothetical protein
MRSQNKVFLWSFKMIDHQWQSVPWVSLPRSYWIYGMLSSIGLPEGQDEDPWFKTHLGKVSTKYHAYVAGEFYRILFDSKSELWKIPRGRGDAYKDFREMISNEAELWVKTWQVLEGMESLGLLPPLPKLSSGVIPPQPSIVPLWFRLLVQESELLIMNFFCCEEDEIGAVVLRKKIQSQNSVLKDLKNPFCAGDTQLLVDRAIKTAEEDDQFRVKLYMPMVAHRMKISELHKKRSSRAFDLNGKLKRQGRRKNR